MFQRSETPEDEGTEDQGADVTWESVLTREEIEVPAAVSGNTEELVGLAFVEDTESPVEDAAPADLSTPETYFGFEETVSVADRSFPSAIPAELEETVQIETRSERRAQNVVVEEDALIQEAPVPSGDVPTGEEDTQLLRRSLLGGPSVTATPAAAAVQNLPEMSQPGVGNTEVMEVSRVSATSSFGASPSFEDAMSQQPSITYTEDSLQPELPSRALPRVLSVLLTLVFTPIAWYLVADAAARLAFAPGNPMLTGVLNIAALGELVAGLIAVIIIAILAAQSSLGLVVTGAITVAVGIPFLVVPSLVQSSGFWGVTSLENFNTFGANVVNHFMATGFTGLFLVLGTLMVAFGVALASARRAGRGEEFQRAIVAETNPPGLKARWGRKATQKSQK